MAKDPNVAKLQAAREELNTYSNTKSNNGKTPIADDDPGYQKRNAAVTDAEQNVPWYRR